MGVVIGFGGVLSLLVFLFVRDVPRPGSAGASLQEAGARDTCSVMCRNCDAAAWRAVELKMRQPELFENDRLFALQYPLFPKVYSRGMLFLRELTGDQAMANFVGRMVLRALFLVGVFALTLIVTRDPLVALLVLGLSFLNERLPLSGGPRWGLSILKPGEVVGAAFPWLLLLLHQSVVRRCPLEVFAGVTALFVYVYPRTPIMLLGAGLCIYVAINRRQPDVLASGLRSVLVSALVLTPFAWNQWTAGIDPGPPRSILRMRAPFAFFPSKLTFNWAKQWFAWPILASGIVYPLVRRKLPERSLAFLIGLAVAGAVLTLASGAGYLWTGLVKFVLTNASTLMFFPIFVILALGARHFWSLTPVGAALALGAFLTVGIGLDSKVARYGERRVLAALVDGSLLRLKDGHASAAGPRSCDLAELGEWARRNTPTDAVFLIPPIELDAGFRVWSHRALVIADKDGGNSKYGRTIANEWWARMEDVQPAYRDGDLGKVMAAADKYSADYVVLPSSWDAPANLIVFENEGWTVITLSPPLAP